METTHTLEAELNRLAEQGFKPMTRRAIDDELRAHGYRIHGRATCFCTAKYISGEFAGSTYPAAHIQVFSIKSGKSFANIDSPRDCNLEWLQANRDRLFYVVNNAIATI